MYSFFTIRKSKSFGVNTGFGGGGATRPLPRDGGVEELRGETQAFAGTFERICGPRERFQARPYSYRMKRVWQRRITVL